LLVSKNSCAMVSTAYWFMDMDSTIKVLYSGMVISKIKTLVKNNKEKEVSIASSCVIIKEGKALLVRVRDNADFKFPGGHVLDTETLIEGTERQTRDEIGCEVDITGDPIFYLLEAYENLDVILIHYPATIKRGEPMPNNEIVELTWVDIDSLPANVMPNVAPILEEFRL
jgi:ADP-ribose pyrophosphatase YjhB (NUDIX family)